MNLQLLSNLLSDIANLQTGTEFRLADLPSFDALTSGMATIGKEFHTLVKTNKVPQVTSLGLATDNNSLYKFV